MLSSAHPIQVLVCDPSADKNVKLIRLLADCGQVNVKQVDDPQKFSLAAAHIMPDLLVLGDNFPEVPTIQLIRQLKKAPLLSKIPIVLHAKNTNESFVNPILAQGVTATIPYPGTQRDVVEALGRYFRLEQSPKVLQLMQEAPFFEGFTREDLRHFVRLSIARKYQSGETICSQGDVAESLFVMLSGTA